MFHLNAIIFITVFSFISNGCSHRLNQYPLTELHYSENGGHQNNQNTLQWWKRFNDPQLISFIEQVLEKNADLAVAGMRIYRSMLQSRLTETHLYPDLNGSLNISSSKTRHDNQFNKNSSFSLTTHYEVDLWGKLARQRDAKAWEARATQQDMASTRLSLIATAARLYWRIGAMNQKILISQKNIDAARKTVKLIHARFNAGSISWLGMISARQNLLNQENHHQLLLHQRTELLNTQSVLLNNIPGMIVVEPQDLPVINLPTIRSNISVLTLSRRPDIKAAELRLSGSLANTDIVRLSYYPHLNLTGSIGETSKQLLDFFKNPITTLGAGLTLPFLEWKKAAINNEIADNTHQENVLLFEQALYKALEEVENALSYRTHLISQEKKIAAHSSDIRTFRIFEQNALSERTYISY